MFSAHEQAVFDKLDTPFKIQDYLDKLPVNFETNGETCYSPRLVIKHQTAHCIEAAIFAAAAIKMHGGRPLLLDLQSDNRDYDHVVCLFKYKGLWGAISKSNHHALRYRDPVYQNVRELAMSYFHEYLNLDGQKTLRAYSRPISLNQYEDNWLTADYDLWAIANDLDNAPHIKIVPAKFKPRPAGKFESRISNITEWS